MVIIILHSLGTFSKRATGSDSAALDWSYDPSQI
jgi:hypothetical protein